jgi:hypothetical protein
MRKLMGFTAALLMAVLLQGCGSGAAATDGNGALDKTLSSSGGGSAAPTTTFTGFAVVQVDGALSGKVVAFFSEDMDPASITNHSFTVADVSGKPVLGTVLYIGVTAVFTPVERFQANTGYIATVSTSVRSLSGVPMAAPKVFAFTTPDPSQLTGVLVGVTSTEPSSYATDVALDSGVNVTFHQLMDPATVNAATVAVYDPNGTKLAGQVHYTGYTASFVPATSLSPSTTYRLVVSSSAKSLSGVNMDDDYKSLFTTGDGAATVSPQVVSTSPLQGDTGVSLNSTIVVDFNEAMDTNTINTSSIQVSDGHGMPVDGSVTYVSGTAVFTPAAPLSAEATYTVSVTTDAASAGGTALAQEYSWSFTTNGFGTSPAPTVVFTNPSSYQSMVWTNATISIAFSTVVDPATLNAGTVQVTDQDGNLVTGSVSYLGNLAVFTPDNILANATQYTVTLSSGIKGVDGASLVAYSWKFTTAMPM